MYMHIFKNPTNIIFWFLSFNFNSLFAFQRSAPLSSEIFLGEMLRNKLNGNFVLKLRIFQFLNHNFNTKNLIRPVSTTTQLIKSLLYEEKSFMSCIKCVSIWNDQPFFGKFTSNC